MNKKLIKLIEYFFNRSLRAAIKEQRLLKLWRKLQEIVPDISDQYSNVEVDRPYIRNKIRGQHAFQISLVMDALSHIQSISKLSIVDIGDSAGTHLTYLRYLLKKCCPTINHMRLIGLNIDPMAVERIRKKGIEGICCRAEKIAEKQDLRADILLSFEMLEHLSDPIVFLDTVSKSDISNYFVLTIPFLAKSRVGLHHIRNQNYVSVDSENTHIFELCPSDWKLLFQHAGWRVIQEKVYRQYPRFSMYRLMKSLWKKFDFEGFYGVVLIRDRHWAEQYKTY